MIKNISHIVTPNLLIRPYILSDAAELRNAITETLESLLPWMPWALNEPQDIQKKEELISSWSDCRNKGEDFVFAIFDKTSNFAGSTGLHPRVGPGALETGYWIRKKFQGKGFATEAAYAMTKAGLLYSEIEKMIIKCDAKNEISSKIPRRLRYSYTGESFSDIHNAMHLNFCMNLNEFKEMKEFEKIEFFLNDTGD